MILSLDDFACRRYIVSNLEREDVNRVIIKKILNFEIFLYNLIQLTNQLHLCEQKSHRSTYHKVHFSKSLLTGQFVQ